MSWISDKLLGYRWVRAAIGLLPQRGEIEFAGEGVSVVDDATNKRTVVTIAGGGGGGLPISETPPTEAGQFYVDADGRLWGWSPVWSAPSPLVLEIEQGRDWWDRFEGGATTMSERALSIPDAFLGATTIMSAVWIPEASLAANGTNYARVTLSYKVSGSPATPATDIMTVNTSVTGFTATTPRALAAMFGGAEQVPAGCYLTWNIAPSGGSPPNCPAGRLLVRLVRTAVFAP